ncbi:gamma-mobile-trio protein GmtX [Tianweitania sp.]|uniref:gamma-mobile-trio protein GmtX n=1 Tax=Tianweitania sp. TaxID=2021634 RepID=UPI00289CC13B|nr:gamma-mobile-trio protein GmtX [Tianweitania sp.]
MPWPKIGNDHLAVVERVLTESMQASGDERIQVKLKNLDEVCRHLVLAGGQRITVPSVVLAYAARFPARDQAIAESSIRNKRGGRNPYLKLYQAWYSVSLSASRKPAKTQQASGQILDYGDLTAIGDQTVRHSVSLLITQNRSLRNQLTALQKGREQRTVTIEDDGDAVKPFNMDLALDDDEVEAVQLFVKGTRLKSLGIVCTGAGGLKTSDGRALAEPGFMDALKKICASYKT